jgi:hypothetical protein
VNIAADRAAVSAIAEKLSTLARPLGGLLETACAANVLTDKSKIGMESGTRKLSCMLDCPLVRLARSGVPIAYDTYT